MKSYMKIKILPLILFAVVFGAELFPQNYMVSGAGTSAANGVYVNDGTYNGKQHYTKSGSPSYYMFFNSNYGRWLITTEDNGSLFSAAYWTDDTGSNTPPVSDWHINLGSNPVPTLSIAAPTLVYSATQFDESINNDGSIDNSTPMTITHNNFAGGTFTGSNGDNFVAAGKVVVTNLPSGLTAVVARVSSTVLSVTITGSAASHAGSSDVSNLTFTFQNSAFSTGTAAEVVNYAKNDLVINFSELLQVGTGQTYTTIASAIAAASSGDILSLAAQTFTEYALSIDNKSLRFKGQGATNTIIQAAASYNTATDRIFNCTFSSYSPSNQLYFEGVTLRYGKKAMPFETQGSKGGALLAQYATVTLKNCEVYGNVASIIPPHGWYGEGGGALCLNYCNLIAENSTFADNVFSSSERYDMMGGARSF